MFSDFLLALSAKTGSNPLPRILNNFHTRGSEFFGLSKLQSGSHEPIMAEHFKDLRELMKRLEEELATKIIGEQPYTLEEFGDFR